MPKLLRVDGGASAASVLPSLFIAAPTYGSMPTEFVKSLLDTQRFLTNSGYKYRIEFFAGNCHVDDSRNYLVRNFLETDFDQFVFVDSDMGWQTADFVRLISSPHGVIGATYPLKQKVESYCVRHLLAGEPVQCDVFGAFEVDAVPTGFLKIERRVLEALDASAQHFGSKGDSPERRKIPLIFERAIEGETRWGGDYNFCRKWRATGGKVHLLVDATFEHVGEYVWTGNYGQHLLTQNDLLIPAILAKIKRGEEKTSDIEKLLLLWGNAWAIDIEGAFLLMALIRNLPAGARVLEAGSGLSTLLISACLPDSGVLTTLEHDLVAYTSLKKRLSHYGIRNVQQVLAPIGEDQYYTFETSETFDAVFCDGPPRIFNSRARFYKKLAPLASKIVIVDDVDEAFKQHYPTGYISPSGRVGVAKV